MPFIRFIPPWIHSIFACMGGCFESCSKPSTIIAVDEPSKGLRIQGRSVSKDSLSDDFWTSENCDVDNSGIQSQRSISSMSMSNQPLDPSNTPGNTSNPAEFVNHGFLLWNQTRQQWLSKKRNHDKQIREPSISWNASYESLLGTNKRFGQPIPLPEMVDFLVDVWEQEGLYD